MELKHFYLKKLNLLINLLNYENNVHLSLITLNFFFLNFLNKYGLIEEDKNIIKQ